MNCGYTWGYAHMGVFVLILLVGGCLQTPTEPLPSPTGEAVSWLGVLGTMTVFPQGRVDFTGDFCDGFSPDPWCEALLAARLLAVSECALSDREEAALRVDGTRLVITSDLQRGQYHRERDEIRAGSPGEFGRQLHRKWGTLGCALGS